MPRLPWAKPYWWMSSSLTPLLWAWDPKPPHFGAGKWSRKRVKELKALQIELHIGIIMAAILRSCLITLNRWQAEIITLPPPRSWGLFLPYSHPTASSGIFAFSQGNYHAPKALEEAGNCLAQGEKTRHEHSPGVYVEFVQQQHLHCHPVQENILGQIRAASGAERSPHRYHPACVGLQLVGKHTSVSAFLFINQKLFSWWVAQHFGTSGWSVLPLACTEIINDFFSGGLMSHLCCMVISTELLYTGCSLPSEGPATEIV